MSRRISKFAKFPANAILGMYIYLRPIAKNRTWIRFLGIEKSKK